MLSDDRKAVYVRWCKTALQRINQGESNYVYNIISVYKFRIYAYDPDSKQQAKILALRDEPKPTKTVHYRSTSKKVATFLAKPGHVDTFALEDRKTANAKWYTTVCLTQVVAELRKSNPNRRNILYLDYLIKALVKRLII